MILPIVVYGDPVLRQRAAPLSPDHPGLAELIANMWDTMYGAEGVGLAAPQVGHSVRLFMVDASPMSVNGSKGPDGEPLSEADAVQLKTFKHVFINPEIVDEDGAEWAFEEGCLSIPGIRELVSRKPSLRLRYVDEQFQPHELALSGLAARVVQHEYDHIEGKLFIDYASPLKRQLLKPKLERLSRGQSDAEYPVKFYRRKQTVSR
jgi:peptide deformylase